MYTQRHPGGFVDLPSQTTPIDSLFLNRVEASLLRLDSLDPTADGQVLQWVNSSSRFGPALLLNKNIAPGAAIDWSKLNTTGKIVDADVAGAAGITKAKLNYAPGWVDSDIAPGAAIQASKIAGLAQVAPTMVGPTPGGTATFVFSANEVRLVPFSLIVATTLSRLGYTCGTGTATIDIGIYYSDDELAFTRVVSSGSVANSTGNKLVSVASTVLTPVIGRRWYFALSCSSATPTFYGTGPGLFAVGNSWFKAASFPLPAALASMSALSTNQPTLYGLI